MASCCLLGKERVWEGQEEADDDSRHLLRMCSAGDLCSPCIVFPEMTDISLWQPSKPDETPRFFFTVWIVSLEKLDF